MTAKHAADATEQWQDIYKRRLVSAVEAVSNVKSGDRVYLPGGQQVGILLAAFLGHAENVRDVVVEGDSTRISPGTSTICKGICG